MLHKYYNNDEKCHIKSIERRYLVLYNIYVKKCRTYQIKIGGKIEDGC